MNTETDDVVADTARLRRAYDAIETAIVKLGRLHGHDVTIAYMTARLNEAADHLRLVLDAEAREIDD